MPTPADDPQSPTDRCGGSESSADNPFAEPPSAAIPAVPVARVAGLDVVRGVALLGILLLNIVDFAWPSQAYDSVSALYYTTDSIGEIPDPDAPDSTPDEAEKNGAKPDEDTKEESKEEKSNQEDWMFLADPKPDLKGAYPAGIVRIAAVSTVWDVVEWAVVRVFFANKMRTLFCLLFGAGLIYLTDGLIGRGIRPVWLYYRRMLLLLLIGLLHGSLLWQGDILYGYAAVGLYLYPFRRLKAKTLARVGVGIFLSIIILLWVGIGVFQLIKIRGPVLQAQVLAAAAETLAAGGAETVEAQAGEAEVPEAGVDVESANESIAAPDAGRNAARKQAVEALWFADRLVLRGHRALLRRDESPRPERLTRDIRLYRDGTWLAQVKARMKDSLWPRLGILTPVSLLAFGWLMILGMSLAKSGFFAAEWPVERYRLLAFRLVPLGWGIEALVLLLSRNLRRDSWLNLGVLVPVEQAVIPMLSLGYAAAIILLMRSGHWRGVTDRLAMVGRMALSNYLAQSILCTTLFYSFGLRLYGAVPRIGLVPIVLVVWAVEIWWSPRWLARHPSGPVEWCWRSLAALERQPWRRAPASTLEGASDQVPQNVR